MSNLNHIIEEIQELSPEEQKRLFATLGQPPTPLLSEQDFVRRLRELGVLETVDADENSLPSTGTFHPVPTTGKAASEIILEERR